MYALVVKVTIDPNGLEEAQEALKTRVLPAVKQAPGLVAGYWLAPEETGSEMEGLSILIFDSEQNAQQGKQMAENSPTPQPVRITSAEVKEIAASL